MTELINSYLKSAQIVKKRMDELSELMKKEKDIDTFKSLQARRNLLEDERYDMLGIVSQMIELSDDYKKASGDC